MEAARDFIPFEDEGQGADRDTVRARQLGVDGALAALRAVSATAVEDAECWGLAAASDFAGSVEEISRTVEYLQVVAASAVDRARKQSAADRRKGQHLVDHRLARRRLRVRCGVPGCRRRDRHGRRGWHGWRGRYGRCGCGPGGCFTRGGVPRCSRRGSRCGRRGCRG